MRVIQVAPTAFGPAGIYGGGERYPLELARALAAEMETELVVFGARPSSHVDPSGLRIHVLQPTLRWRGHPARALAPGLLRLTRPGTLIHVHHLRAPASKLAALGAVLRGQRRVVTDHGLQGGSWGGRLSRLFHAFLTVSRYSARELRAPADRTHVIYGGADPRRFRPYPALTRSGVLFVGRLTPHKGIDRLIRALPEGAHLRVVGSAGHDAGVPERDYPQHLQSLASGRDVQFLGPLAEQYLPTIYRQAAVLALPSVATTCYGKPVRVSELLGLCVLEAMASGTPVVCSRIGGLAEVVEDGVTGFLVEPGDVGQLHDRLDQVLRDRVLAARLGRNARELVVERFTWQACAQRCLDAYAELLPSSIHLRRAQRSTARL